MAFNHDTIFKMCDAIILMDGEPEAPEGEEWTLKKRRAFDNSDEVKGFFFATLERTLKGLNKLQSDTSIADYMRLQEIQQAEKIFLNMITGAK
jgi:hypothetical protein